MEGPKKTIGEVFGKDACNNNDVSDVNAAESEQEIGLTMPAFDDDFNNLSSHMSTLMEQLESPVHFPFNGSGLEYGGAIILTVGSTGSSLPAAQGFGSNDGVDGSFGTGSRNNVTAPHPRQRQFRNGRTIIDSETMEKESEDMDMDGGDDSDNNSDSDDTTYKYDTETDSETFTDDVESDDDSDSDDDDDDSDDSGDDDAGGPDYMDDDGVYSGDDYGDDEPPRVVHIEFAGRIIEAMPIYLPPPSPDRPFVFEEEDDTMEASNLGLEECEHEEASTQQLEPIVP